MEQTATWRALLRDTYLSVDRRTLGLTRIALGFFLTLDMLRRAWDWLAMFSSKGVLPSAVVLARPQSDGFSFFTAFNTPGELWCLWAVGMAIALSLLLGWRTKIAQVLALVYWTSMNGRVLLIENGGYVVQNLLLLWTMFMPLGDRFSLDSLRASYKREHERTEADLNDRAHLLPEDKAVPHFSLAMLAVLLQISALYFFNVVHKTGPAWADGTAVHFVLYNDRMITPLLANVRDYVPFWLVQFLTRGTLAIEAGLVLLLLTPLGRPWARIGVLFGMCALHLGFGMSFQLGPFAWSCCTFSTLMIPPESWDLCERTMRRPARARVVLYRADSPVAFATCRLVKRLDRMELLTFQVSTGELGEESLGVLRPDGSVVKGALAFSDILAALPLGASIAWIFALPGVRGAADALLSFGARINLPGWFGVGRPAAEPAVGDRKRTLASKGVSVFRELLVFVMLAAAFDQAAVELWVIKPYRIPQPKVMARLSHTMRFLQGWFMFSPNPVMDDGTIVVDAITVDGRHIDPFSGKEPNFDLPHARSLRLNQIWGDYFNRIRMPGNAAYREAMKDYMLRLPERTKNPNDALVSGEVFWIQDMNPPLNSTESYRFEKNKLFSFQAQGPIVAARGGETK